MGDKKKYTKSALIIALSLLFGVGLGTGAGYLIFSNTMGLTLEEKKLLEGYRLLKEEWLFGNEETEFASLAMKGMVSSISDNQGDPYTFYTDNKKEQGLSVDLWGFGFSSHSYDGGLYITEVHLPYGENKPLGWEVGDILLSVKRGEENVYDFALHSVSEIREYLNEEVPLDTRYLFTVKRADSVFTISTEKKNYSDRLVQVLSRPKEENGNTLTVKVNTFLGDPVSALIGTLEEYKEKTERLVLDLRGNGGGYVSQAENMAKLFVRKGTMIDTMMNKDGKKISSCYQDANPVYSFKKYGIILDSNSASASESFTLAMRAGTDCTVYGFLSYGKGIAQSFKYFSDNSVIRYTYAYVYGPERENETMYDEGKDLDSVLCIHKKGILPDVPYEKDYTFLSTIADYTGTIGISEYGQNFFLRALSYLYPSVYPETYSASYHFVDAVKDYATKTAERYEDTAFLTAFNSNGAMNKKLNDRFVKECFDAYLKGYDTLTAFCEGANR